jgi:hypothetical protein
MFSILDIIRFPLLIAMVVGVVVCVRFCLRHLKTLGSRHQDDPAPMPRVRVRVIEREPEPAPEPDYLEVVSTVEALPPSSRTLARRM